MRRPRTRGDGGFIRHPRAIALQAAQYARDAISLAREDTAGCFRLDDGGWPGGVMLIVGSVLVTALAVDYCVG